MLLAGLAAAALALTASAQQPAAPAAPDAQAAPSDPAANSKRIATALDGSLVDTQNGDNLMRETAGYRRLLQLVSALDPAEAKRRSSQSLDRERAMKDPDALRGEFVRVRGLLLGFKAERLDQPLDGAVDVWEGAVSDTDASDGIIFDTLTRPDGLVTEKDIVDVEGVFYRTARFENQKGKIVEAPYIVARNITKVDTSALPVTGLGGGPITAVLVGAAVVFLVVRVMMLVRDRRGPSRDDAGMDAIRRAAAEHARAARAAGKPPAGPPNPPGPPAKPT